MTKFVKQIETTGLLKWHRWMKGKEKEEEIKNCNDQAKAIAEVDADVDVGDKKR